jgi:hypothetical protein
MTSRLSSHRIEFSEVDYGFSGIPESTTIISSRGWIPFEAGASREHECGGVTLETQAFDLSLQRLRGRCCSGPGEMNDIAGTNKCKLLIVVVAVGVYGLLSGLCFDLKNVTVKHYRKPKDLVFACKRIVRTTTYRLL